MSKVTLSINEVDIEFDVTLDVYNKYINELQTNNKITPSINFLNRTVREEQKPKLEQLLKLPGMALQLVGVILEEYAPEVSIIVKKSSALSNSTTKIR